ncbi:MAG: hypothetical protein Q4A66_12900 [Eubacteriales bacterium]|nr:hypothetical protein [Eubacteriales bacterium]
MFETLDQFRNRTQYIYDRLPQAGFAAAPGCAAKVGADGRLRPFYGDTTIFDLGDEDIEWLTRIQDALYDAGNLSHHASRSSQRHGLASD